MNTSSKMIVVLTLITMLSGGLLYSWDRFTLPRIEAHRLRELQAAVADVLPAHARYEERTVRTVTFYVGKTGSGEPVGVAFRAVGSGFQGPIALMVGVNPGFTKLTGIKVLEQIETPGLGTRIVTDPINKENPYWFTGQFTGLGADSEILVVKNRPPATDTEIQAITGATISSKSIVKILNKALRHARTLYYAPETG